MSLASLTPLHARADSLRDPTREELYNGPKREQLPEEIQRMAHDDTACGFCGVSYFVFSEVQELQATAKKYKKTFHDFVRFMERERRIAKELKTQVAALQKSFDTAAQTFHSTIQQLSDERSELQQRGHQLAGQLNAARQEADAKTRDLGIAQTQYRRAEEEWTLASAMTEQRLRNEILHLSSQLEKCKLLTASQENEFLSEMERERARIKELEVMVAATREAMSTLERQQITERDVLKQQLLAANERVEMEREAAKQLETQLKAVHTELQRVVSSSDSDKAAFATLHHEIAALKQQIAAMDKAKAALVGERDAVKELLDKSATSVHTLRLDIVEMEQKAQENAATSARLKQEYAKELEQLRSEHGQAINRMQRDHQKAIEELKTQQKTYIEFLQQQTSDAATTSAHAMQTALVEMETKLQHADKQLHQWKHQAQQSSDEVQQLRLSHQQATTHVQAVERQLADAKLEVRGLTQRLQLQAEQSAEAAKLQLERQQREAEAKWQQRLDSLQTKYDTVRRENEQLVREASRRSQHRGPEDDDGDDAGASKRRSRTPQQAWGDGNSSGDARDRQSERPPSNQEQLELEKLVESLRKSLDQKDKEIALLQQTVHRECLERTSLLEKMRSGKVLPDLTPSAVEASLRRGSASTPRRDTPSTATNPTDNEDSEDVRNHETEDGSTQPKAASFYERLRRAGQRSKQQKARK